MGPVPHPSGLGSLTPSVGLSSSTVSTRQACHSLQPGSDGGRHGGAVHLPGHSCDSQDAVWRPAPALPGRNTEMCVSSAPGTAQGCGSPCPRDSQHSLGAPSRACQHSLALLLWLESSSSPALSTRTVCSAAANDGGTFTTCPGGCSSAWHPQQRRHSQHGGAQGAIPHCQRGSAACWPRLGAHSQHAPAINPAQPGTVITGTISLSWPSTPCPNTRSRLEGAALAAGRWGMAGDTFCGCTATPCTPLWPQ